MKKYILLLVMVSGIAISGCSQKVTPPAAAKSAFEKAYTGASKAKWTKEKADFEVSFVQGGKEMSAVYDANGILKETEVEIKESELPAAAAEYIKLHFKGAKITETAKITKSDGKIMYEAEVKKKDLMFDADGKYLEL
jgi:hypothetical protein